MMCNSSTVMTTTNTDGRLGVHQLRRGRIILTHRGGKSSTACCCSSPSSSCLPMPDSSRAAGSCCCCCSGGSRLGGPTVYRPSTAARKVTRKYRMAAVKRREYLKLKAIVPAVSTRKTVSKLTVIEEAIKYIDILHATLATRIGFNDTTADFCDDRESRLRPEVNPDEFIRQLCFGSFHAARSTTSLATTGSDGAGINGSSRQQTPQQQQQQRPQPWRRPAASSRPPLIERQRAADGRSLVLPTVSVATNGVRTQSPTPAII